jgi:hypothetical protein
VSTDFQIRRKAPLHLKSKEIRNLRFVNLPLNFAYIQENAVTYCSHPAELTKNKCGKKYINCGDQEATYSMKRGQFLPLTIYILVFWV